MGAIPVALLGVAFLSACGTPAMLPAGGVGLDYLVLDVSAGHYSSHLVPGLGDDKQFSATVRISQPRRTTQWMPLMNLCVHGANVRDRACVSFAAPEGDVGYVDAVAELGGKASPRRRLGASFRLNQAMNVVIKPEARGFSVLRDGVQIYSGQTDFDVVGYGLDCASARCEFAVAG